MAVGAWVGWAVWFVVLTGAVAGGTVACVAVATSARHRLVRAGAWVALVVGVAAAALVCWGGLVHAAHDTAGVCLPPGHEVVNGSGECDLPPY